MIYVSKGTVCKGSTEGRLVIARCGCEFVLSGMESVIWLNGQIGFAVTKDIGVLKKMERKGLVEYELEDSDLSRYRILTRCICCPTTVNSGVFSGSLEKELMIWLTKAGLRLSTAELIYLIEKQVKPTRPLLYESNRQALVETIYTPQTIADNILEAQMEHAACRDAVTQALERLLKKKRLVLL